MCVSACDEARIEEHHVNKGVESVPAPADDAVLDQNGAGVTEAVTDQPWVVPPGWLLDPEPRSMRLATYRVQDTEGPIEVALSRFPGRVGGELANVNRWRGQLGLGPIEADELESILTRFEAPGFAGYEVQLVSGTGAMLAAGVYEQSEDRTWFVRTTVAPEAVDRLAPQVFGVARSIAGLTPEDER